MSRNKNRNRHGASNSNVQLTKDQIREQELREQGQDTLTAADTNTNTDTTIAPETASGSQGEIGSTNTPVIEGAPGEDSLIDTEANKPRGIELSESAMIQLREVSEANKAAATVVEPVAPEPVVEPVEPEAIAEPEPTETTAEEPTIFYDVQVLETADATDLDAPYFRFAREQYAYNGKDRVRAWQIFCQNFAGMQRFVNYNPDMELLNTEQKQLLKAHISC